MSHQGLHKYPNHGRSSVQNPIGSDSHSSWPYSEPEQDSLFNEALAHPHLNTTPCTSPEAADAVPDDSLSAYLIAQHSVPLPYEPPSYPPAQQPLTHTPYHTHPYHRQPSTRYHIGLTHGARSYNRSSCADPRRPLRLDVPVDGNLQAHYYLSHDADLQIQPTSIGSRSLYLPYSPSSSLPQYRSPANFAYPAGRSPSRGSVTTTVAEADTHYQQSATMSHAFLDRTIPSSRGTAQFPYAHVPTLVPSSRLPTTPSPMPYNVPPETPEPTTKKKSKRFNAHQLEVLNRVYASAQYPPPEMHHHLAKLLDMSARSVQIWFQNRRQKSRRGRNPANPPIGQVPVTPPPSTSPIAVHPRSSSAHVSLITPMGESSTRSRSQLLAMTRSGPSRQIPSPLTSSGRPRSHRHWLRY